MTFIPIAYGVGIVVTSFPTPFDFDTFSPTLFFVAFTDSYDTVMPLTDCSFGPTGYIRFCWVGLIFVFVIVVDPPHTDCQYCWWCSIALSGDFTFHHITPRLFCRSRYRGRLDTPRLPLPDVYLRSAYVVTACSFLVWVTVVAGYLRCFTHTFATCGDTYALPVTFMPACYVTIAVTLITEFGRAKT